MSSSLGITLTSVFSMDTIDYAGSLKISKEMTFDDCGCGSYYFIDWMLNQQYIS